MSVEVMGIVNCTPDSFYDGGFHAEARTAIDHGRLLVHEGASVIDIGGESSRPGAKAVPLDLELERVIAVVEAMADAVRVSIDTVKAELAHAAIDAGATLLNDVSGQLHPVAAERGVAWVAMHRQGTADHMQDDPSYDDVVSEVHEAVLAMAHGARAAGVEEVFVDPGIGFGKTVEHNLKLLAHLPELVSQAHKEGFKVTVGTSRKRFLSELSPRFSPIPPEGRLPGTLATASWLALCGVDLIRVHDVIHTVRAVSLASHAQERGTSW
ncbi:MAG: dihydropteroate synthase [Actinomycetota bacterium]